MGNLFVIKAYCSLAFFNLWFVCISHYVGVIYLSCALMSTIYYFTAFNCVTPSKFRGIHSATFVDFLLLFITSTLKSNIRCRW